MRLAGKVAIVTGAGSGFGRGIAELFAEEGAKVIVADIHATRASDVAAGIGSRAVPVTVDVTVKSHVEQMMRATMSAFGGIDILVNNAGITHKNQSLMTVTEDEFDRIYAVNVKSIYLTTLAVVPEMEKRGGGSIINTASTAGLRPRPGLTWYNGSKGAVITLTKSMAAELAPRNIRVNAINPVIGETGMLEDFMGAPDTAENRARFLAGIPLGRMSKPSDIANAALFLADPASNFVTGVAIEVDGGRCI
ncbi:MAG: SDR family oxidoreductase [Hyphomicrobium sp.]|jgi:3-oxoacyl-[acyl-carrier protein] reductase|uniref:SDR family oxidoreductase n=1 Tax=Hyphomicrobium sp. TaxID=82 RepID=UPI0025BED63A|nr:SDR family oxidoreductase [Hyphomicrobium sp.]MBX9864438.1 SDR family oxidoreductase [Hyphomicrobium sp.]